MKKTIKFVAVFAAAALTFGVAPAATAANATKACLALDTGGVDDKAFNSLAYAGAKLAAKANSSVTYKYLGSATDADYAQNIKSFITDKCDIIIGVGFLINDAIVAAAKANPSIHFAIVDQDGLSGGKPLANLKSIQFQTDAPSFQAGYLAAGFSKTGKVATYGGINMPTVTIFMDGYAKGVAYYNTVHKKSVQVLGWDTAKKDGTFVGSFGDSAKALQISKNFEQQGADVIFPVAGGLVAATAANAMASKKSVAIWVDADGFLVAPQYKSVILTSVLKGVDLGVKAAILEQAAGKFTNTGYVGTMKNSSTYLAPYHSVMIRKVSPELRKDVEALGNALRKGTVTVK